MISVGVIGYGYWGPNLVRNFNSISESKVTWICDPLSDRLAKASALYPALRTAADPQDLFSDPSLDAVLIATPVFTHFDLAMKALQAGKHVLVEKPLTSNSEQARRLLDQADKSGKVLMVDHTFIYTAAVRKIKELIVQGTLGELYYFDSVRINLGLFQHDVNVLWDLAVHDLSIMDYLLGAEAQSIAAVGMAHIPGQPENIAYLTCFFENNLIAHFHVNWLAPVKIRQTLIGGSRKMVVYDDLESSEKIKIYDKGVTLEANPEKIYQLLVGYRAGDMYSPHLNGVEALREEARHFVECVEKGIVPITGGPEGLRVVKILEAANQSMKEQGRPISIK